MLYAETAKDLQYALNKLKLYCDTWKFQLNINKNKVMTLSYNRQTGNNQFLYHVYGTDNIANDRQIRISRHNFYQKW